MKRRIAVGLMSSGLVLGAWAEGTQPRPSKGHSAPEYCAWALNIEWSVTDGATERLEAFETCVKED